MAKNIYVGNLAPATTDVKLRELFEEFGAVDSAEVITDRYSGESRGFAFVKMNEVGAKAAIAALNGKLIDGRNLKVNEAKPRESGGGGGRPQRGGGGPGGRRRY